MTVWTVGHSTRTLEELVAVLRAHGIAALADVRTVPRSRRHPHFNTEALARSLPGEGIEYTHVPRLGGFRKPAPDSPNTGWRNASFRGYADYTATEEFAAGLAELCALAERAPTAMMCAEATWWRCHRRLVSDRLVVAGHTVVHIESETRSAEHELTPFAVAQDGAVEYPAHGQLTL
jgi:uncharacterized protein (DUF488 family)